MKPSDIIGWLGTIGVLLGYILLSTGVIGNDLRYFVLTLVGSLGVAYISYVKKAWQPCVLNIVFALFSIVAIVRLLV